MTFQRFDKWFWSMFERIPAWPIFTLNQLYVNWEQIMSIYVVFGLDKNNMCVSDHPTRLTLFSPTLREVMTFWRQNLSKISAKMDNFLIFEDKSHSGDNTKIWQQNIPTYWLGFCRPMWSETHFFGLIKSATILKNNSKNVIYWRKIHLVERESPLVNLTITGNHLIHDRRYRHASRRPRAISNRR